LLNSRFECLLHQCYSLEDMPKQVRVILLEHLPSLGHAGDIVQVSEGYARNLLFPSGKAALATKDRQHRQAREKAKQKKVTQERLATLQQQAENLQGTELAIAARVKEGEDIYGSITTAQIIKELNSQAHLQLKAGDIKLKQPIKKLGSFDVTVTLSPEVETNIRVTVVADPKSLAKLQSDAEKE
jgi:large subunit ribosomal protein L9